MPIRPEQIVDGELIPYGQRPLNEQRCESMYQQYCKDPFTLLTTAGMCILDKYTTQEQDDKGINLLTKFENTTENWETYHQLQKQAVKKPHGGQHGCKAQTLAFDRGNTLVINAINSRGGIISNVFDLSNCSLQEQVKAVNFLVSEHSDVQQASKQKNFMDTMFVTRAYVQNVLGCKTVKALYHLLNNVLAPEVAEAERQMIIEKMNISSNKKMAINNWSNITAFLRFALQGDDNWDRWGQVNSMHSRFELKGQDKTKEALLAKYARTSRGRGSHKQKAKKAKKRGASKKNRRMIGASRPLSSLLAINTSEGKDSDLFKKIRDDDIPVLTQSMCKDVVTAAGDGSLVKEVLNMVINGIIPPTEMGKMRKSLSNMTTVEADIMCLVEKAVETLHDGEQDESNWDTMKRCGEFTQEDFRDTVINIMSGKMYGSLTRKKRDQLASTPTQLTAAITNSLPQCVQQWVQRVHLKARLLKMKDRANKDAEASFFEQLSNDDNEVFEFQLHHSMRGFSQSPLGKDDDMKRYLVLIHADNTDGDKVLAGLPPDIHFSMVKGSMNYGLNMFDGDDRPTNAEELGKLFAWLKVFNEDKPCSVFLGCMPEQMGMVSKAMQDGFCNAGTECGVWYKPYKHSKHPALGLVPDIEFRVIGWCSENGKKLARFFSDPLSRSRVTVAPAITVKLIDKKTKEAYNPTEENPAVSTSPPMFTYSVVY